MGRRRRRAWLFIIAGIYCRALSDSRATGRAVARGYSSCSPSVISLMILYPRRYFEWLDMYWEGWTVYEWLKTRRWTCSVCSENSNIALVMGLGWLLFCWRSGIQPYWSSPSTVVFHTASARPAIPSVNSRSSLVSGRSLHVLELSARWHSVCTISFCLS